MPIDSNSFNSPYIELFFILVSVCAMTPATFFAIKLEGISDLSNLNNLNEKYICNKFTNTHSPHPIATVGINIPVQGINVSAKSSKRLVISSRAARHYESASHYFKTGMMKWKILKYLDLKLTELEDKKNQDDADVPVINNK